jgi:methionine-S-sulfoxide reductase
LVEFDPKVVTYGSLLRRFFRMHDPTTPNPKLIDPDDQYRSQIFTFSDDQRRDAEKAIAEVGQRSEYAVATRIEAMPAFWMAEEYHQQYEEKTGRRGCAIDQDASE